MPEGEQRFSFIEVVRDLPEYLRAKAECEWGDWFDELAQKRALGTENRRDVRQRKRDLGIPKTQAQTDRKARERRMRKLRIKQIFSRLSEVGELELNDAERAELAWARGRREARRKIDARRGKEERL